AVGPFAPPSAFQDNRCMTAAPTMSHEADAETTRTALIAAARHLFGTRGYRATKIGLVAYATGLTTGAIYHHFQSKEGLFQATVEAMLKEFADGAAKIGGASRWQRLRARFHYTLERHSDEGVYRIMFVDAPHVMGSERLQEVALRYAYGKLH